MTNSRTLRRLLCLLLTLAMVLSLAAPAVFAEGKPDETAQASGQTEPASSGTDIDEHALTDIVRVSIELEGKSTIDAGYPIDSIAENRAAVSYRSSLRAQQDALTARIEQTIGSTLDVRWNLTLAMNVISANEPRLLHQQPLRGLRRQHRRHRRAAGL